MSAAALRVIDCAAGKTTDVSRPPQQAFAIRLRQLAVDVEQGIVDIAVIHFAGPGNRGSRISLNAPPPPRNSGPSEDF